ncbi:MAG: pentapeptide repeat-containing protein [Lentisphaeria bacterium]|nr:pentapeptide repeat-containing protein [Lentisphaeria bacterium]
MKKETVKETVKENLLFAPERKVMDADAAQRMAAKCSDYNDSRTEARNFKCLEFRGVTFKGEDLSGIEAHYSRFIDCTFEEVKLDRMEGYFMELNNCEFKNSSLENANLSYARISDCNFYNCNLNGVDMPFASGNWAATSCMMERCTAQNANLMLVLSNCNVIFEGNYANIEFDVADSNLRRSEFNDGCIKGKITKTDLTNSEWNRSNLSELEIVDCATSGMETEDASGVDNCLDNALEDALNELEEDIED